MRNLGISILAVASSVLLSPSLAFSSSPPHGGTYRGPAFGPGTGPGSGPGGGVRDGSAPGSTCGNGSMPANPGPTTGSGTPAPTVTGSPGGQRQRSGRGVTVTSGLGGWQYCPLYDIFL